jgi:hypothetical protein
MLNVIIPTETMLQTSANSENKTPDVRKLSLNLQDIEDNSCSSDTSSITSETFIGSSLDFDESLHTIGNTEGHLVSASPRSILMRRTKSEPKFIKNDRKSWNCLPPPTVQDNSECLEESRLREGSKKRSVSFTSVSIRSYEQTMGDNPSVSYGPPISLDWDYEQHDALDIDEFESERVFVRRSMRQLAMNYYRRKALLTRDYGFTEEELMKAKKDADKTKMKRFVTNYFLPVMKVEDALESAGRKAKRAVGICTA